MTGRGGDKRVRVHLVRHGEVHNPADVTYGRLPGFGLSPQGRAQAEAAGQYLLRRAEAPLSIVSSPLQRAMETAVTLQRVCQPHAVGPLRQEPRLIEAGSWMEGLPRRFAPTAYLRAALDPQARSKTERARTIAERMRATIVDAIRAAAEPAEARRPVELMLVSHQRPIRLARAAFEHGLGTPYAGATARLAPWLLARAPCSYASVTTLELRGGSLRRLTYWAP